MEVREELEFLLVMVVAQRFELEVEVAQHSSKEQESLLVAEEEFLS